MSNKKHFMFQRAAAGLSCGCDLARRAGLLMFLQGCGCIAAVLFLPASPPARADTYWNVPSAQSGDWSLASNWTDGLPTSTTDAYISNGGTAAVSSTGLFCNNLWLGAAAGNGSLQINTGSLFSNSAYIGNYGAGSVVQAGGQSSFAVGRYLLLGMNSGSGMYTLTDGSLQTQYEEIGFSGTGTFTQSGGINSGGWFQMSASLGSTSSYYLSGTGLLMTEEEWIGNEGTATFTQAGGTHTVGGNCYLGSEPGSRGTYNLSGGQFSTSVFDEVGCAGSGTFSQTGGSHTAYGLVIGRDAGGSGTYNFSNGEYITSNDCIGMFGSGTFRQSGGTHTTTWLSLGSYDGSRGTYYLNGGTLITEGIDKGDGTAVFNFGGGTLKASAPFSVAFPITLTRFGGDATVDTAGQSIAFSGPLSGLGGLVKRGEGTMTLSGSNTYTGTTTISAGKIVVTGSLANNGSNKVLVAKDGDGLFANGIGDASITRRVAASGTYAGMGSAITSLIVGELPTKADILAGNSSAQADVSMAWRTRTATEKTQAGGGLIGEVLDLSGVAHTTLGSDQTDTFVLQMSYDEGELTRIWGLSESQAVAQDRLYLGSFLPSDNAWHRAIDGNFGGTAHFVGNHPYSSVYFALGNYGVDTANNVVWAVVNHSSQFAAVPEPSTITLLGIGLLGLLGLVWRQRQA